MLLITGSDKTNRSSNKKQFPRPARRIIYFLDYLPVFLSLVEYKKSSYIKLLF
ncbi:hypothetical protein PULV_a0048 [Pseudoalteromonas ulvae UL12]|nr:hypothetical protein [Pseudoalteromonas ulvae UL12]